jgi:hypothetical protein
MTADPKSIDLSEFMAEHLERPSPICSVRC